MRWDVLVDGNEVVSVEADELGLQSVLSDVLMKRFQGDGAAVVVFSSPLPDADGAVLGDVLGGTFDDRLIATFVCKPAGTPGRPA